ncbi:hypothetical protein EYC84_000110 [Monilinia fructicola]|uniref:Uncharacterized protein n=1 Tax=Monilinia fructicola TaxID=38448 RepID=A0A5M9JV46_MONFR|nr:hypothetical protein EYC84_000110 [Monilinia fructicola]
MNIECNKKGPTILALVTLVHGIRLDQKPHAGLNVLEAKEEEAFKNFGTLNAEDRPKPSHRRKKYTGNPLLFE